MYRFAPSPTGDLHLEDLQVALFNFICAKQKKDKFIIRIQDYDRAQNIEGKDQEILELLNLFGISYDEVYYQSENLKFHRQLGSKLLMDGNAFSCFCAPKTLDQDRYDGTCKKLSDHEVIDNENPFVIRIKKPTKPEGIDDFVILKVDKTPTNDFASAIDDMLQNIGMIIQSEKYLTNTPKQELIRAYLGYSDEIKYVHLPAIVYSDAHLDLIPLLEEGYLPSAIINYLILISTKTPHEIFTLSDAVEWFDIEKISKSPAEFDIERLKEINRAHIELLNPLELSKFLGYSSRDIGALAKVYLKEASTINEIKVKIDTIFAIKTCEAFSEEFETLKELSKALPYVKEFHEFKATLSEKSGLEGEKFSKPLKVLLTGAESGPDLNDIYPYIKNYLGEIIK